MTGFTETIGQALVHSIWQCALAALLLRLVLFASRDAAVRYWAAFGALLGSFGAFAVTCFLFYPDPAASAQRQFLTFDPALIEGLDPGLAPRAGQDAPPWIAPLWALGAPHAPPWRLRDLR